MNKALKEYYSLRLNEEEPQGLSPFYEIEMYHPKDSEVWQEKSCPSCDSEEIEWIGGKLTKAYSTSSSNLAIDIAPNICRNTYMAMQNSYHCRVCGQYISITQKRKVISAGEFASKSKSLIGPDLPSKPEPISKQNAPELSNWKRLCLHCDSPKLVLAESDRGAAPTGAYFWQTVFYCKDCGHYSYIVEASD